MDQLQEDAEEAVTVDVDTRRDALETASVRASELAAELLALAQESPDTEL